MWGKRLTGDQPIQTGRLRVHHLSAKVMWKLFLQVTHPYHDYTIPIWRLGDWYVR